MLCMDGRNSEWRVRNLYVYVFSVEATEVLNKKRNRNENIIIGMSMHTLLSLRVVAWSIIAIVCVKAKGSPH